MTDKNRKKIHHGLSGHPLYKAWHAMKSRCENPNHTSFYKYGARGIKVCARWQNFALFLDDMGERPSKRHSIDRIDNSGNYTPDNCRWATPKEQACNGRHTRFYTINGETKARTEWCDQYGIHVSTFRARVRKGWTPEKALTTPPLPTGPRYSQAVE